MFRIGVNLSSSGLNRNSKHSAREEATHTAHPESSAATTNSRTTLSRTLASVRPQRYTRPWSTASNSKQTSSETKNRTVVSPRTRTSCYSGSM